jgi:acetolactate synthase-1/2/3 large subunit/5-guanidino-2-oxopentanoate decarboxylase
LIDRAFQEFYSTRQRPKHIQVGIALAGSQAESAPEPRKIPDAAPYWRPAASQAQVAEVAEVLKNAELPMVILGGGARHAADGAREVLSRLQSASFVTYAGRGLADPADDLHFGSYLGRPETAEIIGRADVVLVVGSELSEVDLWRDDLGAKATMIRVDLDAAEIDHPRADIAVVGDAQRFLEDLAKELPDQGKSNWRADDVKAARARWRAETDAERPGIVPICEALQEVMPKDTMYYSDMTQFAYVGKEVWDMDRPGHWHHPYGFGTLGYALPAAIGGAMARPGLPTVCIAGDYGFQYTLQDLGTAVELGLPLPILLWDNAKLKEIEDAMIGSQIAPNAVIAMNPDFSKLAEAYGAYAAEPATLADLQKAVIAALASDRPTIIRMTPALTA